MEERTRAYLRGRFRDHYRRVDVAAPPAAAAREWGYIPWTEGPETTMVRHRSLLDIGTLSGFLERQRPRHVYFSAGRYDEPGAPTMEKKGWRGSDLVFDIDADHLPGVDPDGPIDELLSAAKAELQTLLDLLETDFGVTDPTIVFSGGRGYHVHVRDESFRGLDRDARSEIAEYVAGTDVTPAAVMREELVAGTAGRTSPAHRRSLPADGGWGRRLHESLMADIDDLLEMERSAALTRIQELEGFGERKAEAALTVAENNYDAVRDGNIDVHSAFVELAKTLMAKAVSTLGAHVDAPVTTDINRLIRLPGSLHGGTGLVVTPIDRETVTAFDPLENAIADTFRDHHIAVELAESVAVRFAGQTFRFDAGTHRIPEHVGVFLMAGGRAEKGKE